MSETGTCKHGEFDLEAGCHQCIADRMGIEGNTPDMLREAVEQERKATDYGEMAEESTYLNEAIVTRAENHAIININPELSPFYFKLKDEVVRIEKWAGTLQVTDPEQEKLATNDLALIKNLTDAIENRRKEYTAPLNDYLKLFNDAFRKLSEPLKAAETTTKQKIISYQRAMADARRKAEEANAIARAEALRKAEEIKRETGEIVDIEPEKVDLPPAVTKVRTDLGTASQTDNWKYEIIDIKLIPAKYFILDEVKLGKIVRAGERDIPGIRIYSEKTLRITPR